MTLDDKIGEIIERYYRIAFGVLLMIISYLLLHTVIYSSDYPQLMMENLIALIISGIIFSLGVYLIKLQGRYDERNRWEKKK